MVDVVGDPAVPEGQVLAWLLAGDPAIRWQALRDLGDATEEAVHAERQRVAEVGWGARLLSLQDDDGRWAQAPYSPKWTSTTYTLLLLHWLGLPAGNPQAVRGCRQLWDGATVYDGGLNIAKTIHKPETCITAMLILAASSFGLADPKIDVAVRWLLAQQLDDGGWNCESIRSGSRHGSFHTSISTLDALLEYQSSGGTVPVEDAMRVGRLFFLEHRLWHSHRTGDEAGREFRRFPFPPQWHFDVLRGLEHFWRAGADRDDRLLDGINVIRHAQSRDGTWPLHRHHPGKRWFSLEGPGPSRWATLRALRVLRWWTRES